MNSYHEWSDKKYLLSKVEINITAILGRKDDLRAFLQIPRSFC